jgi:5'-3' exonuclease
MVTFRSNNSSNNRRPPFRSNNRRSPFRSNNEGSKFSNNDNFQRKVPGRNNHNAVKLIEKYNDLAREALANEDKILSENYFQHADHFTRVQNEQESLRMARVNSSPTEVVKPVVSLDKDEKPVKVETETVKKTALENEVKKVIKTINKTTVEKKPTEI